MRRLAVVVLAAVVLVAALPSSAVARHRRTWPGDAPYSMRRAKLREALSCKGRVWNLNGRGRAQPVLLVHGTGVTRRQNWGWNYWPALHDAGFEVCWVALPKRALRDIQKASEYVAFAFRKIGRRTREKVDVIGHSQGGLEPRWAIRWFRAGRRVDDYVSLASPNHGTVTANAATSSGGCFPACWQMRTNARFIAALNHWNETPGPISYTNIYSSFDEVVQPAGTSALKGARNVLIQDVCPARPVGHISIAADAVAWELAIDALTHRGAADPARISGDACSKTTLPGAGEEPPGVANMTNWSQGEPVYREPRLRGYARPHRS